MKQLQLVSLLVLLAAIALPLRAENEFEPPVPVRTVSPTYPYEMRRSATPGLVTVSCLIDEKGSVQEAKADKSSHPEFAEPAVEAVRKWRFRPARRDGANVSYRVKIPIQFSPNS